MTTLNQSELASGRCEINLHRLGGDETGYEASTRILRDHRGQFFCENGATAEEAMRALADAICGNNPSSDASVTRSNFVVIHDERPAQVWEIGQTYVVKTTFGRFVEGAIVLLCAVSETGIAKVSWHGENEDEFGDIPAEYLTPESRIPELLNICKKLADAFNAGMGESDPSGDVQVADCVEPGDLFSVKLSVYEWQRLAVITRNARAAVFGQ